jgi:hypothetical protein
VISVRFWILVFGIGIGAVGLGFGLGYRGEISAIHSPRLGSAPRLERPGQDLVQVAEYFAKLNPPPPPPPPPKPPPPPPKPDIAIEFRAQVRALSYQDGDWVVLVEKDGYKRTLKRGDLVADGWVISTLSSQQAELRNGKTIRKVSLFEKLREPISETRL